MSSSSASRYADWVNPNRKLHQVGGAAVEVQAARDQGIPIVPGPDQDLAHDDAVRPRGERERIGERVLVEVASGRRERVHDVAHLVALAEPDQVAEIVGDDGEMVAVIGDVGRQIAPFPPRCDSLLAPVRCLPIHFGLELVGLDEPRHRGRVRADLREEQHDTVGAAGIPRHCCLARAPALHGAVDEGEGIGGVPDLRSQENGSEHESS